MSTADQVFALSPTCDALSVVKGSRALYVRPSMNGDDANTKTPATGVPSEEIVAEGEGAPSEPETESDGETLPATLQQDRIEDSETTASNGASSSTATPTQPEAEADQSSASSFDSAAPVDDVSVSGGEENATRPQDSQPDLPLNGGAGDEVPEGYVKAGTEELWISARGNFEEKDLRGYAPSPESGELRVDIANFDGPLDLLLHLIRQHALDILDIPIATITATYLSVLDDMRTLNLDVAGEFLLMAAQLTHIKSKMLLPREEVDGEEVEEEDPRLALVRRLLEYQRFQDAAGWLAKQEWLGRDIFTRPGDARGFDPVQMQHPDDPTYGLVEFAPIKLIKIFDEILRRSKKKIVHEVVLERLNVGQRINDLVDFARERASFNFTEAIEAFGGIEAGKGNMIVTFLAILEMTKFRLLKIHQAHDDGAIYITSVSENLSADDLDIDGYDNEAAPQGATA